MGYAFVNFTTPAAAWRFYQALNNHKWDMFGTKKITHICYARIQVRSSRCSLLCYSQFHASYSVG